MALPFYDGDRRNCVVRAIKIAEQYAQGNAVNAADANIAGDDADAAGKLISSPGTSRYAAYSASDTAFSIVDRLNSVRYAVAYAVEAGVSQLVVDQVQFTAIAADLGLVPESDDHYAAIAALAVGNIELAQEIAGL